MAGEKRDEAACISAYFLCVYVLSGNLYGGSSTGGSSIKSPGIHVGGSSTERYGHQRDAAVISLYALVGPVAEEVVFRGFIMDRLLPYGKGFAIVLSAVLFGVMHGNFLQGLFAFGGRAGIWLCCGGIFSEMVCLIHVINNMVFSDLLGRVTKQLPETARSAVEYGIALAFLQRHV